MTAVTFLGKSVGNKAACNALTVPCASFYRNRMNNGLSRNTTRSAPPLALSTTERQAVLDVAHEKRFWDSSPYQIYATLLDEGKYLG